MKGKYYGAVKEIIPVLIDAARKEILPRFGKVVEETKILTQSGYKDTVTAADKGASKRILERVRKKFPGSYSEEDLYEDRFDYDLVWHFDPVDGTREFCEQIKDGYAVNAALLQKLRNGNFWPVSGIIYRPGDNTLVYNDGKRNYLFRNDEEHKIKTTSREMILGWTRKIDQSQKLVGFYKELGDKLNLPIRIMPGGGIGASIVDLLEGKINLIIYNYNITREWDWAMSVPIITSMGGFICDLNGNAFTNFNRKPNAKKEEYDLNGVVASIAFKKEEVIPHIPKGFIENRF